MFRVKGPLGDPEKKLFGGYFELVVEILSKYRSVQRNESGKGYITFPGAQEKFHRKAALVNKLRQQLF